MCLQLHVALKEEHAAYLHLLRNFAPSFWQLNTRRFCYEVIFSNNRLNPINSPNSWRRCHPRWLSVIRERANNVCPFRRRRRRDHADKTLVSSLFQIPVVVCGAVNSGRGRKVGDFGLSLWGQIRKLGGRRPCSIITFIKFSYELLLCWFLQICDF